MVKRLNQRRDSDPGRWTRELWRKGVTSWLRREGQDHYYRDWVVVPNIVAACNGFRPASIIDLGCGDGYTTDAVVAAFRRCRRYSVSHLCLADRSGRQLKAAAARESLQYARLCRCDFGRRGWTANVPNATPPRLFLAVFVIQELPTLTSFFEGVSELMEQGDRFIAVTVAPRYASALKQSAALRIRFSEPPPTADWRWAGEYPISINGSHIYVPHFQRHVNDYVAIAATFRLRLSRSLPMTVPSTRQAEDVFKSTVYGCRIQRQPSSILFDWRVEHGAHTPMI